MKIAVRAISSPAFWVILIATIVAVIANVDGGSAHRASSWAGESQLENRVATSKEALYREGTPLTDIRGRFKQSGERILFYEDGTNRSMKCLENLWLQRILESQKTESTKVVWVISAKIYEFESENFLQVEIATKTR